MIIIVITTITCNIPTAGKKVSQDLSLLEWYSVSAGTISGTYWAIEN